MMNKNTLLRIAGVIGVVIVYFGYQVYNGSTNPLLMVLTAIVALVAPEVLDQLPFGPNK
jgi:hypothetical protein